MIKMVLTGHRSCEKLKLLTHKRVPETKLNFNFKQKKLGQSLRNLKEQNKDYLIFKIIANYHLLDQVLREVLSQT